MSLPYHPRLHGIDSALPSTVQLPAVPVFNYETTVTQPQKNHTWLQRAINGALVCLMLCLVTAGSLLFALSRSHYLFTVLSGSMEPAIHTGSLIVVKPAEAKNYNVGSVVAFQAPAGIITHRIHEALDATTYRTKGDANAAVDTSPVNAREIIGPVTYTVPYIGYVFQWLRTKVGFSLLLLLPATFVILYELRTLRSTWRELRWQPTAAVSMASVALLFITPFFIPGARALFSDTALLQDVRISTAAIFPTPTPSPTPTPTPTPTTTPSPTPTPTCSPLPIDITLENTNTGPGSVNENIVEVNQECNITHTTETTSTTTIEIDANTGNNTNDGNTDNDGITTGDINIDFSSTTH